MTSTDCLLYEIRTDVTLPYLPGYVKKIAGDFDIGLKLVSHDSATDTCEEKAALLREREPRGEWHAGRVIKAIYAEVAWKDYAFITPEIKQKRLEKRLDKDTVEKIFHEARLRLPYFLKDGQRIPFDMTPSVGEYSIPPSMEQGTCSPFPRIEEMAGYGGKIKKIFVHDDSSLDEKIVDISVGGKGEEAHKTSLHLPYGGIFDILRKQFGPCRVYKVNFY